MIGGLLLGFIEIMTVAFLPALSGYRDAFAFIVLVLVLLVKPTGLVRPAVGGKDMNASLRNLILNLLGHRRTWEPSCSGPKAISTATRSRS